MMNLERELRDALERKSPPAGFAESVMKKIEQEGRAQLPVRHANRWRAVAAATLLTAVIGGWAAHQAAERREGERAKEEVLLALRITSEKLSDAREHVNDIGSKQ
jgi:hypothetical protein